MTILSSVRQRIARQDPGYLVVLAICLLAIWPLISRSGLPQDTDSELHIFRLAELSRLIRAGEFFPRWAPNFYFGYGYPIFNYYAPLTYYLGLIIDFMPVLGPVAAVKGIFILGYFCAGFGMYGYIRPLWGREAGLVAAAAYIYSPYILFIDPHARGDLAETFSFALFPLGLMAIDRLRRKPNSFNWLFTIGLVAGIIMAHNLMALVMFAIFMAWFLWQELTHSIPNFGYENGKLKKILLRHRLLFALGLGVGVSATFWLVVALERDAVNLSSLIGSGGHYDFRNHFIDFTELLKPSLILDWGATEPAFRYNFGIAQWLLATVGIAAVAFKKVVHRSQATFFIFVLVFTILLMLDVSEIIWESVPLLPFLQFPWRLLGISAIFLAIFSGIGVIFLIRLVPDRVTPWLTALIVGIIMVAALPLIQIPSWPADFGPTTADRILYEELSGRWLGTTSTADFVPATVDVVPKPEQSILDDIVADRPIDRVNRASLPQGTDVENEYLSPLHFRYHVVTEHDFPLRLFLFDFPGWIVTVDGNRVEPDLGRPEGFIVIPLKAGKHVVDVRFGNTPARNLAMIISISSIALAVLGAWMLKSMRLEEMLMAEETDVEEVVNLKTLFAVSGVSLILLLVNFSLIEVNGWLHYEYDGQTIIPAMQNVSVNFDNQITLKGYDGPDSSFSPGEELDVTLYWQAMSEPITNYQVFVHLFDGEGNLITQSDKLNPGDFPTRRWPFDRYVRDEHILEIPRDLDPGEYYLSVGLWVAEEGWRLPIINDSGEVVGDSFPIEQALVVD